MKGFVWPEPLGCTENQLAPKSSPRQSDMQGHHTRSPAEQNLEEEWQGTTTTSHYHSTHSPHCRKATKEIVGGGRSDKVVQMELRHLAAWWGWSRVERCFIDQVEDSMKAVVVSTHTWDKDPSSSDTLQLFNFMLNLGRNKMRRYLTRLEAALGVEVLQCRRCQMNLGLAQSWSWAWRWSD